MLFCDGAPSAEQSALLGRLRDLDKRFLPLVIDSTGTKAGAVHDDDGAIARLYGAAPGTLYLLRPDLHIAGRWKTIVADEVLRTSSLCLGIATP